MRNKLVLKCRFAAFNTYKPNKVDIWMPHQSMQASLRCNRNKQSFGPIHQPCETLPRPSSNCSIRYRSSEQFDRQIFCIILLKERLYNEPFSLYTILFPRKNKSCGHSLTLRAYAKSLSILISSLTACFQGYYKASSLADK